MTQHDDDQGQAPLEPPATNGAQQEPDPPDEATPARKLGRRPKKAAGTYMLLAQDAADETYVELGWYRGHGHDNVKRQAVADAEAGHQPELLAMMQDKGAILRPVPAESWDKDAKATGYKTTRSLEIG